MTDAECEALREEMYARLLVAEVERDAALWQLHEQSERVMFLEARLTEMRKALD